jgi:hypothetical protein
VGSDVLTQDYGEEKIMRCSFAKDVNPAQGNTFCSLRSSPELLRKSYAERNIFQPILNTLPA